MKKIKGFNFFYQKEFAMRFILSSIILIPLCAFSQPDTPAKTMTFSPNPTSKNTIIRNYSNESKQFSSKIIPQRSLDYPTQIIRTEGKLNGQQLDCDQVNETIQETILDHIASDNFTYNMYVACSYDPDTGLATQYNIHSYFDPLSDEAVGYLKSYLKEYNGSDLMGTPLRIESAKGLIIAISITAGTKKNPDHPPFIEYRQDRSNFHFKSNYEMKNKLFNDLYENFFSNDPEKILPFLDRWVFSYAGKVYFPILRDSNYVEFQPERIFLMEQDGDIFVSNLKYYFGHNCNKYANHRCLKQG